MSTKPTRAEAAATALAVCVEHFDNASVAAVLDELDADELRGVLVDYMRLFPPAKGALSRVRKAWRGFGRPSSAVYQVKAAHPDWDAGANQRRPLRVRGGAA